MKKNNCYVIGVSGSSNSGKTTFMNELKERMGDHCILINERIREMPALKDRTIDEVRLDPDLYCQLQFDTLRAKLNDEMQAVSTRRDKLIVTDRTTADQFMYLAAYVEKNRISDEMLKKYGEFCKWFYEVMISQYIGFYDLILFFPTIRPKQQDLDKFRTSRLPHLQKLEENLTWLINIGAASEAADLSIDGEHVLVRHFDNSMRLSERSNWKQFLLDYSHDGIHSTKQNIRLARVLNQVNS